MFPSVRWQCIGVIKGWASVRNARYSNPYSSLRAPSILIALFTLFFVFLLLQPYR
jgi:hypothetical protein